MDELIGLVEGAENVPTKRGRYAKTRARDLTMGQQERRETWELWREDDNGNRFLIARGSHEDLEQRRLQFEARGHKQRYWVAPARPPEDSD